MTQTVTVHLPEDVYEQFRRAAIKLRRSVDDLLVEAITVAAPSQFVPVQHLRSDLAQMALLNDAALFQAARATMTPEQRKKLEALHHKQQQQTLTKEEQQEIAALEQLYRDTLLVRAHAAVLLKQRQYDVSDPAQFNSLD